MAGCGGDSPASGGDSSSGPLVVSAAASLTEALTSCSPKGTRLSFAGSDELAAQIRQGVRPGVFAAANTKLPEQLHAEGRAGAPEVFATNELVLAVPRDSPIHSLDDLASSAHRIAVGARSVPVGAYTRQVLARLDPAQRSAIEAGIRSEEPDVKGVVGKIVQRAVDAGFVYASDVRAATDHLRAIRLPAALQPRVAYGAAVVRTSPAARRYLDDLVSGRCQRTLRKAGFGAP